MDFVKIRPILPVALIAALSMPAFEALAHHRPGHNGGPGGDGDDDGGGCTVNCNVVDYNWMHGDVGGAHDGGWTGDGTHITVVDDFTSGNFYLGRLRDTGGTSDPDIESFRHGEWTSLQTSLVAPDATIHNYDFNENQSITLHAGFDSINLSYGLITRNAFAGAYNDWSLMGEPHESVMWAAHDNLAFVAKAAGNDGGKAVGASVKGNVDVLAQQLIGMPSVIFVGALEWNPDDGNTYGIASYSNIAGSDPTVQNQFLVVGVEGGREGSDFMANHGNCGAVDNGTCLYGTSFAAPIVAGYGAIVAEKFTSDYGAVPVPSAVAQRLLDTARIDTITGYSASIHGQGEASLVNALAPDSLN